MLRGGEGKKLRRADTESTELLCVCVGACATEHVCKFVNTHSSTLALNAVFHTLVAIRMRCQLTYQQETHDFLRTMKATIKTTVFSVFVSVYKVKLDQQKTVQRCVDIIHHILCYKECLSSLLILPTVSLLD